MHVIRRYNDDREINDPEYWNDNREYWDGEKFTPKSGDAIRYYQKWDAEAEIEKLKDKYGELEAIDAFKNCPKCHSIHIDLYHDNCLEHDADYICRDCRHVFP